ncbi:metallophosphoesterase [Vibrio diabolicus]|uniref:metallophosphoesterase n=1 Tax=Vibrio diabolicus TaxID=50719 RepID=UPI0024813ACE|nr:metallophosphoesterase [Vibrio diabolicus]
MALIDTKYLSILFSEFDNYSLRGNSALWDLLKEALINTGQSYSTKQLLQWVDQNVGSLIETGITNQYENTVYIESLNEGGMSGGVLDVDYWQNSMRPELERRCTLLEQGLQYKADKGLQQLFFIGDIHAQTEKLMALLDNQGFELNEAEERGEDVKLVFVGDLIDNHIESNTDHIALLETVKSLVDNGQAICLLGNHEFNAIGWFLKNVDVTHLRDRNKPGNLRQHQHFLEQVGQDSSCHQQWVEWFMTLPLYLNAGDVRAIHACWHDESIERLERYLNPDRSLKTEHWADAFNPEHELFDLIETLLKGPEIALPGGTSFKDKNGITRDQIRVAWWKDQYSVECYRDLAMVPTGQNDAIPDIHLRSNALAFNTPSLFPVVVGHYTLSPTHFPQPMSDSVICVDYNAGKDDNPLVGYLIDTDDWQISPIEMVSNESFASSLQINVTEIITSGIEQFINVMLSQAPELTDADEYLDKVAERLLIQWDPIGIYDPEDFDEAFEDEYSSYVYPVARLTQTEDASQVAAYLLLVEKHFIGVERDNAEYECAWLAYQLVKDWTEYCSDNS